MKTTSSRCFLQLALVFLCVNHIHGQKFDTVAVSVYYDAFSQSSQQFITDELYPSYPIIGNRIILDLVPYGTNEQKQVRGIWKFNCGSNQESCQANIIHACAFNQTKRQQVKLEFANCIVKTPTVNADYWVEECANATSLPYEAINTCEYGDQGEMLYVNNGFKTKAVSPPIYRTPTVSFNGEVPNSRGQQVGFLALACSYLNNPPKGCPSTD